MSVQQTMILVWVLALVALTLVAAIQYQRNPPSETISMAHKTVQVGNTEVVVEVADTPALQTRGLSDHTSLKEGEGMLFVFDEEGTHGIWMKDMDFAIDIIWASLDGTVITIAEDVAPGSYPQEFHASEPTARHVLEVPAGFVKKAGVAVGSKIVVQ